MPTHTFHNLPDDILIEVLSHADCQCVLAMRLTCKRLDGASRFRKVWISRIQEVKSLPGGYGPDEAYENYTVEELEKWVIKRLRNSGKLEFLKPLTHYGVRYVGGQDTISLFVLPGGRWLLTEISTLLPGSHEPRKLYVTDLDQPDPQPRDLLQLGIVHDTMWMYSYWVEEKDIRLLVYRLQGGGVGEKPEPLLRIYQLSVVGHGVQGRLEATLLKSTQSVTLDRDNSSITFRRCTLDEEYVVCFREDRLHSRVRYLEISRKYLDSGTLEISTPITLKVKPQSIMVPRPYILPGNRILLVCSHVLEIYDIPSKSETDIIVKPRHTTILPNDTHADWSDVLMSDKYISPSGGTFFTLRIRKILHTLRISTCPDNPIHLQPLDPELQPALNLPVQTTAIGVCNCFFITKGGYDGITQISYPTESEDRSRYTSKKYKLHDPEYLMEEFGDIFSLARGVDEVLGRIITIGISYFLVFDPLSGSSVG